LLLNFLVVGGPITVYLIAVTEILKKKNDMLFVDRTELARRDVHASSCTPDDSLSDTDQQVHAAERDGDQWLNQRRTRPDRATCGTR
jgi:hypothetical protein